MMCRFFHAVLCVSILLVASRAAPAAPPTGKVAGAFGQLLSTDTHQTRVRLLTDNMDSWYARWYVIDNAEESIDVTYFIVENDLFGRSMLGLLYKKAKQGVKIRIMLDARGTKGFSKRIFAQGFLMDMVKTGNVEVKIFKPWHAALSRIPRDIRELIASNHDKIILADREWAITGGRNVSKNYFLDPEDMPTAYRDTDVLLQGEAIGEEMSAAFTEEFEQLNNYQVAENWFFESQRADDLELARRVMQRFMDGRGVTHPPEGFAYAKLLQRENEEVQQYSRLTGYAHFQHDVWQGRRAYPVKILDKHSFHGERNDITENMIRLFDQAEDYILIQNPYVIITKEVMEALLRAKDRGVRVILHTNSPTSTDSLITQAFFLRDWKKLLRDLPNLRIFAFHQERKLHAKVFVIDDEVASIGTYNMDPMSQNINSEVMAVVQSRSFATRTRLKIEADIADSVEYKIEIDDSGVIRSVHGPEDHLKGAKGWMIRLLSKLGFLRPIV